MNNSIKKMKDIKPIIIVNSNLWNTISVVAAIFSFIICFLIIANYFQINRLDPINTTIINSLVERLSQNPNDEALKTEIRELDLLARKAYFTNQWQIRTGGYLLLIGVIVLVISVQLANSANKLLPEVDGKSHNNLFLQKTARKWVSIGGIGLVLVALIFAFLTHQKLGETFVKASLAENTITKEVAESNAATIQTESQQPISETTENTSEPLKQDETKEESTVVAETQEIPKTASTKDYPTAEMKSNFPSFRGPGGNGIAYSKNTPVNWNGTNGTNILWKVPVPLQGYNSPVVWGNKVFLSGADATKREVYCFDKNTGKLLWTAPVDNIPGSPTVAPAVTNDTGHAAPTLTTDGKKVYAIFSNGDIIALDMNGKRVWAKNLGVPQNHYGHSSSLYIYENKLIVQYDHKTESKVMALSTETGEIDWNTNRKGKISWASPTIVKTPNGIELLLVTDPFVASYDPNTGKELWRLNCLFGEVGPSLAYADGVIFATNEYASLVAIKIGDQPEKLWEKFDYMSDVPSPVATDKYLFLATSYGIMLCYDAKTGDALWEKELGSGFYSSPILVGDKIYIIDKEGVTHIFKADKEFVSLGENALGESVVSTLAFTDGKIFIRADKNLYCIGK